MGVNISDSVVFRELLNFILQIDLGSSYDLLGCLLLFYDKDINNFHEVRVGDADAGKDDYKPEQNFLGGTTGNGRATGDFYQVNNSFDYVNTSGEYNISPVHSFLFHRSIIRLLRG